VKSSIRSRPLLFSGRNPRNEARNIRRKTEQEVLIRLLFSQFEGYVKLKQKIPPEVLNLLNGIEDAADWPTRMAAPYAIGNG